MLDEDDWALRVSRVEHGYNTPLCCSGEQVLDAHGKLVATFVSANQAELFVDAVGWAVEGGAEWVASVGERERLEVELSEANERLGEQAARIAELEQE